MACGGCGKRRKVTVPKDHSKSPEIDRSGGINFPEDSKVLRIEGYYEDPEDERRLIPEGPPCQWRITGIMLERDGTYRPHHVCRHSQCEHRQKEVDFNICANCPFREE